MRTLYFSHASPFARKIRIVLAEKGLDYEQNVSTAPRTIAEIAAITPTLTIPVFDDGDLRLFESNLIVEYLLRTYPGLAADAPSNPPLAPSMTRPEHHWEDAKTLAVIETFANSMVNLRFMKTAGVDAEQNTYLARQRSRADYCLDWLEARATPEGFAPGWFSIMDINLLCPVGYADARGVMPWRGRPKLEAIVDGCQTRLSVLATAINAPPV